MHTSASGAGTSAPALHLRALGPLEVWDARGEDLRVLVAQPKRVALLTYMALGGAGTLHQREKLCGMFWPDATEVRARLSLRQALHVLRRATGTDVIASRHGDEIGVRADTVRCDVAEFETAIAEQRRADAIRLYRGPFLQDFHVNGVSSEFEWWVDRQRARLQGLVIRAAQELTELADREGDVAAAVRWAREVTRFAPFDEPAFRRLVTLLERAGDRAGALQEYEAFASLLARELESSPSADTAALMTRLRAEDSVSEGRRSGAAPVVAPARVAASQVRVPNEPAPGASNGGDHAGDTLHLGEGEASAAVVSKPSAVWHVWRRRGMVALLPVAALAWIVLGALRTRVPPTRPVLAVGEIHSRTRDTLLTPALIRDLLASDLARIEGIDVVSGERMQELMVQLAPSADTSAMMLTNAARRAGATQVLEGILSGGGRSPLRLDVRRTDLVDGTIRGALVIEAADIFTLADQLSAQVASQLRQGFPRQPLAETRSQSLVAARLYEEGARAWYRGDAAGGLRLFDAAVREDSTFTMAALFASKAAWNVSGDTTALRYLEVARRAARRATERERLLVETDWARATNSPNLVAMAESLATRYPSEPAGEASLGDALVWAGERERAQPHLRLAIESDSTGLSAPARAGDHRWCRGCDAFATLLYAQVELDSMPLAERTAREWMRRRPGDWRPWIALADVYLAGGRPDDARAAHGESTRRLGRGAADPAVSDDAIFRVRVALHAGSFADADRILDDRVASADEGHRIDGLWWRIISLRQQGKIGDAYRQAENLIREEDAGPGPHEAGSLGRIARAQTTFELGRWREAAALFETIANAPIQGDAPALMPGRTAHRAAWQLTHAATAYAAAGDTLQLVRLADAVEAWGLRGANGRDRRLHHYVRGLLLEARRDWPGAERELRLAMASPNFGFTRINLELARSLVAQARPREAIPFLQASLRGALEGSNFYVIRTELDEALARAFAAAGQPDSARVHVAQVVAAWQGGDASYRERAAQLRP